MNPRRKSRLKVVVSILFGVAVAAGLTLYALSQNIDLFYTPSEIVNGKNDDPNQKPEVGQRIRVGGMVVEDTVKRDEKTLKVEFDVNDVGPSITIEYEGILPDLFREGQGIVAQGVLIEPTRLRATEVLAKHDENYMPPELGDKLKQKHNKMGVSESDLKGESERDRAEIEETLKTLQGESK
ncbi:cytochrome c maturation protein CcmE [Actinobacillus equuli subsp. equuli]|uniref:Cytochrome c-type biogenesis protein CcmE n=1 Tax=Actinobacillus equuli TaxID=718 RepID=A0AAX3FJH3_ACTEU|nr:cytochrome c maturation protein CcmE [Actinobacillus equuli]AIZ80295.1 cytochrome C biogenesis protein CcmE [Actinobacillus equuli subsp. equuli]MDG4947383.1 cytochrome c maturation protein CcmE [Actinobacillus equuli subsp. haemolyticus]MDG4953534.1 cytochrome c maturation protein CcmE [Actinobacillus equuli subsp. equuli]WGE42207.1 cytochrome c maturation protein CcmE [Actinobacillus equuli subsp. haemolyticus]WGE44399.1 cytochrome c maturation protein CcmE [Actinobacillus equuli subsp. e